MFMSARLSLISPILYPAAQHGIAFNDWLQFEQKGALPLISL